jgi:hypothetical protein
MKRKTEVYEQEKNGIYVPAQRSAFGNLDEK